MVFLMNEKRLSEFSPFPLLAYKKCNSFKSNKLTQKGLLKCDTGCD